MNIVFETPGEEENFVLDNKDFVVPLRGQKVRFFDRQKNTEKKYVVGDIEYIISVEKSNKINCDTVIIYLEERD